MMPLLLICSGCDWFEFFFPEDGTTPESYVDTPVDPVVPDTDIEDPFVLEDDDREHIAELYVADGDTIIVGGELLPDLDKDLDSFFENLIKE